jgi:hypothetical protein
MRLPTVTLKNKSTGHIKKINQSVYASDIASWSADWKLVGEQRGEGNEIVDVKVAGADADAPPAAPAEAPLDAMAQMRANVDAACKNKRDIEDKIKADFSVDPDLRTYNSRDKLLDLYMDLAEKKAEEAAGE